MGITAEQWKGMADRGAAILVTWLVTKGYISAEDAANYVVIIVGVAGLAWGWWVNRQKALLQSAATVPNTTVVTAPVLAATTPEPNIVSNVTNAVVSTPR